MNLKSYIVPVGFILLFISLSVASVATGDPSVRISHLGEADELWNDLDNYDGTVVLVTLEEPLIKNGYTVYRVDDGERLEPRTGAVENQYLFEADDDIIITNEYTGKKWAFRVHEHTDYSPFPYYGDYDYENNSAPWEGQNSSTNSIGGDAPDAV
ncbi:hypothetical protein [Haloferax sp. Atlit-12N]|uniref:hypothetical protein n=1 Tax=Haloferax sp. Atlit-12N TaxID=2077203 RepID=UPI0011E5B753|nr:hypothetical protein [Haloferax sp. Atlit-12N]